MTDDRTEQWILTSWDAVAEFYGVSRDTVRKDWKTRGMPCQPGGAGQPGHYDVREISRWLAQRIRDQSQGAGKPDNEEQQDLRDRLEEAAVRKLEAQAAIEQIKLGELQGKFADIHEVTAELTVAFNVVRGRLEQIADECAPQIPPEIRIDLSEMIDHKVRLACRHLADLADQYPENSSGED